MSLMLATGPSFVTYEEDGSVTPGTNLPMVDGGTEVSRRSMAAGFACDVTSMRNSIELKLKSGAPSGSGQGLAGHVNVIYPGVTPCFECILPLFPPQVCHRIVSSQGWWSYISEDCIMKAARARLAVPQALYSSDKASDAGQLSNVHPCGHSTYSCALC